MRYSEFRSSTRPWIIVHSQKHIRFECFRNNLFCIFVQHNSILVMYEATASFITKSENILPNNEFRIETAYSLFVSHSRLSVWLPYFWLPTK